MDNAVCWFVLIGALAIIAFIFYNSEMKRKRIREAGQKYRNSLDALKRTPTDTNLRQKTLALGREYARAARDGGKESIFDEVALMNDLNAVGIVTTEIKGPTKQPESSSEKVNIEDRLHKLEELKAKGLITETEYSNRRAAILDEL